MAIEVVPGGIVAAKGFRVAGIRCGIKRKRRDVMFLVSDAAEAVAAGVFTTNVVRAPSVDRNEALLRSHPYAKAIIVNSGNANAGNGAKGEEDNDRMATIAAETIDCAASGVLTASTGVIGTLLPMSIVTQGIRDAAKHLSSSHLAGTHASEAILTTDTFTKEIAVKLTLPVSGVSVAIGGISKGSGMIAPNMATMLGFVTTDAALSPLALDAALREAVAVSFNCLTVDGDTSTNDSCIILASGVAGNPEIDAPEGADYLAFVEALSFVFVHLAKEIARDGEGATKLVTVRVTGTATVEDARKVAKTISESPLVKTALFGNDPNWGRILAASGRAGVRFDPKRATAFLAGTCIFSEGTPTRFDAAALSKAMAVKELEIRVDLGAGESEATFYTCDFSYDYVKINAEYHT